MSTLETQAGGDSGGTLSLEDVTVVCCDSHFGESLDDLLPYFSDENEAYKEIIEKTDNPEQDILSVTHSMPAYLQSEVPGKEIFNNLAPKAERMEELGIDYAIMDPGIGAALPTVNNTRFAVAIANAYNSWLIDKFETEPSDRFRANMTVAHHHPERAAEEIHRVADHDAIAGVQIPSTGAVPPLGHYRYDPIYEAAQEHDLPICLHGASVNTSHIFPLARIWHETYSEDHTMIHPFTQMWQLQSMMYQGVPERYPDLTFVFQESGVGWIGYWKWRMDDHYLELDHELPYVQKLPSEYIDDQFYFTTQPLGHTVKSPKHLAMAIEMAGPENILYASDFPHPDFDPPEELFNRIYSEFDNSVVRGMMGETAMDIWDIS
ncbi:amidohydrolase family protein [Halobellus sp. GM3]|uniref:amidohydrolase family protein n=1 Tax=Halobellus sp. GM3 TaxID=3458410 RepID=UPI00403D8AA3